MADFLIGLLSLFNIKIDGMLLAIVSRKVVELQVFITSFDSLHAWPRFFLLSKLLFHAH